MLYRYGMKIRNIDTFYWVATLRSFRSTANKLNVSQPAISARIQVLEQDLGVAVFVRDDQNVELTPEGKRLFGYAERMMALEQETLDAFSDTTLIEQTIRLGSSETIVTTWLPDFLSNVGREQRGLSFELAVDGTNNLRNALVNREIDLAFLMGPISEATVSNVDLCAFEMVFAATQSIAQEKTIWSVGDIAQKQVLTFASNTRPAMEIVDLLKPSRQGALDMTTSTSLGAIVRLAGSGFGVCAIPKAVIQPELEAGVLVELNTDFTLPAIAFTASYVSSSPVSGMLSRICSDAKQFLAPNLIKNIYQL